MQYEASRDDTPEAYSGTASGVRLADNEVMRPIWKKSAGPVEEEYGKISKVNPPITIEVCNGMISPPMKEEDRKINEIDLPVTSEVSSTWSPHVASADIEAHGLAEAAL